MSAPTRRALLAGASAAVALPAAAPIVAQAAPATLQMPNTPYEMPRLLCREIEALSVHPHPDAVLMALCARFVELDRRWCTLSAREDALPDGPEKEATKAGMKALRQFDLRQEIADMPASTVAGMIAKAQAISQDRNECWDHGEGMISSLVRDLTGMAENA